MRRIVCESCSVRAQGAVCNVPPAAFEDFRAAATAMLFKPRQVVFAEGNPCTGLYLVCHGAVKLYHSDRFGRDHILEVAGPGAVVGELALQGTRCLSISAEALTETQLSFLSQTRLEWFISRHPATAIQLIDALSGELAGARRKVRDLALKAAASRLAMLLIQLAGAVDGQAAASRVHLPYRRRELAEMIGVSPETAIRLLSKLKARRMINVKGRDIIITNVHGLHQVADHDESEVRSQP